MNENTFKKVMQFYANPLTNVNREVAGGEL